jgi:hypothetical protein
LRTCTFRAPGQALRESKPDLTKEGPLRAVVTKHPAQGASGLDARGRLATMVIRSLGWWRLSAAKQLESGTRSSVRDVPV